MLDFDTYLMRHGEFGVQAIIEQIEHTDGIRHNHILPLEDRWASLMQKQPSEMAA